MENFRSQNLRINYFNNYVKSAVSLIFIHGNSHNLKTFKHQYSDPRLVQNHIVAFDLPGHGDSESSEAYSMDLFVTVLKDLIQHLGLKRFVFAGHSLGGHIALQALSELSPEGLFVFGTPPLTVPLDMSAFRPHPDLGLLFKNDLSDEESTRLLSLMYRNKVIDQDDKVEFLKTDFNFREKMSQSFCEGKFRDECDLLSRYKGVKTLIASNEDTLINHEYIKTKFPSDTISVSCSHNMHVEEPNIFNELLFNFIQRLK